MSALLSSGKKKAGFGKTVSFLMVAAMILTVFVSCSKQANTGSTGATTKAATAKTTSEGLTSLEAEVLAWSQAKNIFNDSVLFRLAPIETAKSTVAKLSPDWQSSDRAAAWFAWYADSAGGDWFMVSIIGTSVANKDIGTRSFTAEVFDSSLPKEKTAVSMKDAAAAAKAQGANMDSVTWVEYQCERFNDSPSRLPLWVFTCSDTPELGVTLNYKIYVNAETGNVEGAKNDRNEDMKLPIDLNALKQTRSENHETDLRKFFSFISGGDPVWAVRQLEYSLSPDEATAQMWLVNFQSLKSLQIVSIEQVNLEQWTETWEAYKVVVNISTSEPVEKYGWENGENTRWVTLVPQGGGDWKVSAFGSSP